MKEKNAIALFLSILIFIPTVQTAMTNFFIDTNRIIEFSSWTKEVLIPLNTFTQDNDFFTNKSITIKITNTYKKFANGTSIFNSTAEASTGVGILRIKMVTVRNSLERQDIGIAPMSPIPTEIFDGLIFALPPGNETFPVYYKHPNNIDVYYPTLWNLYWNISGNERTWVHLPITMVNQLEEMKEGEAKFFLTLYRGILHVSEAAAAAILTKVLLPKLSLIIVGALGVSEAIANTILPVIGAIIVAGLFILLETHVTQTYESMAEWVNDCVRLYPGDGFMSWWCRKIGTYIYFVPTPQLYPISNLDEEFTVHIVHWVAWMESWGKEIEEGTIRYVKVEHEVLAKYKFRGGTWIGS